MKNKLSHILISIALIFTVGSVALAPVPADAACWIANFRIVDCVADLGTVLQGMVGVVLSMSATLLSFSLNITIHIKEIYEKTPAIESTWLLIRNLSSMFIIFMLMYASIKTILGVDEGGLKKLVGNVVMAGLLINFSLFGTKALIDASNLVSLQFYRAIAPEYVGNGGIGTVDSAFNKGGLANVLLQSLKIQKIYNPATAGLANLKNQGSIFFAIVIATYGGIILMIFAIISFLAAAIAFAIRTALLLLLMAFSPIYFVGMIFPEIKSDLSDRWKKNLVNQLLFMPVYLLLLYIALRFISDTGFMNFIQDPKGVTSGGVFGMQHLGVIMQYFIAIVFINLPLIGAIKFGAIGVGFADKMTKGFREKLYSQPGFLMQHTVGRGAKKLSGALASSEFARNNPNLAVLTNSVLGKASGAAYGSSKGGYDERFKKYSKARSDYATKNLSLNESEKNAIKVAAESEAMVGISKKLEERKKIEEEIAEKEAEYKEVAEELGPNTSRALKLKEEIDGLRKKVAGPYDEEKEKEKLTSEIKGKKEAEAKKKVQGTFANSLEGKDADGNKTGGFISYIASKTTGKITEKSRSDAADAIRKKMKEGKEGKIIKDIAKAVKEGSEGEDKGEDKKDGGKEKEDK